jgi:putative NAD(P)H nitroreductase
MDALEALKERRSINFFDPEQTLSDEKINELLKLAQLSPSAFNLQPWQVVVVKEQENKERLKKCAMGQPKVAEAAVMFIIIADPAALEPNFETVMDLKIKNGESTEEDKKNMGGWFTKKYGPPEGRERAIWATKNTGLFAMNLMLAARAIGLDSHPMDGFDSDKVKAAFNIPDDKILPMLIAVGNLKEGVTLKPRAPRMALDDFVHREEYR